MKITVREFIKFAKSKPRDEEYDPWDGRNCAVGQFAQTLDPEFKGAGFGMWSSGEDYRMTMIEGMTSDQNLAIRRARTFGELADALTS